MHPILFEIPFFGGITIYSYGVLVALGFLAGMFWVRHEAKHLGENPDLAVDLVFYVILAALIGSRVAYVLVSERANFLQDPISIFRIWEGGLVFYGGLLGAIAVTLWFTRRYNKSFLLYADMFVPGVAIGHAIGRLGCLMAGCCYGRPVTHEHWWTITFPTHLHGFAPTGVPLYPTQLMESLAEICIFLLLVLLRRWKSFQGEIFCYYLFVYGTIRSIIEIYRGDVIRGYVIENVISTSQAISLCMFVLAGVIWFVQTRKKEEA